MPRCSIRHNNRSGSSFVCRVGGGTKIGAVVGPTHVLTDDDTTSYCIDERRLFQGRALAVVRPANVEEVAAVVVEVVANARWAMSSTWSSWSSLANDLLRLVDFLRRS